MLNNSEPPPLFSIMIYPDGRVGKKMHPKAKSERKSFCPAFFKKLAVSKGRAFGRSNERNGGVGACPRPSIVPKKFFGNLFIKKGWA
ncbi:MAG: hypothetical protein ACI4JM_02320, partial [Oscillospiraceae bacterium]